MKKKTKKVIISVVLCVTLLLTMAVGASAWTINTDTGRFASAPKSTFYNTTICESESGNLYLSLRNVSWYYKGRNYYSSSHANMKSWAINTVMRIDINTPYGIVCSNSFMLRNLDFSDNTASSNAMGKLSFATSFYYNKKVDVPIPNGNGAVEFKTVDGWAQIQYVLSYTFGNEMFNLSFSSNSEILSLDDNQENFDLLFGREEFKPCVTISFQPELNAYQNVVVNNTINGLKDDVLGLKTELISTERELETIKGYYEEEKDNHLYWSEAYQNLQNSYDVLEEEYNKLFDSQEGYINMAQLPNLFNAFGNAVVGVMTPILNIRIGGFTLGSVLGVVLTLLLAVVVVRFLI